MGSTGGPSGERERVLLEEELETKVYSLLSAAKSRTVTKKRLTKTKGVVFPYLSGDPVISYLYEGEQPHFIFTSGLNSDPVEVRSQDGGVEVVDPGAYKTFGVITDERILLIIGQEDGDEFVGLPFDAIKYATYQRESLAEHVLEVGTGRLRYLVNVAENANEVESAFEYLSTRDVDREAPSTSMVPVCRECREQISPDAETCPHCGFSPKEKKKSKLWWGGTAALSMSILSPVGWALAARGVADHAAANQEVWEEEPAPSTGSEEGGAGTDLIGDLERLAALRDDGSLTPDEFEELKREILDS